MGWNDETIKKYQAFTKKYLEEYSEKIDCADLALASLADFAAANKAPVKLRYFSGGWKYFKFDPSSGDPQKFKSAIMKMLGALNVIDNSTPINIADAGAGDLIMTAWSASLGHTRVIHTVAYDDASKDYMVTWYEGNLPPVVPARKEGKYSQIKNVYGGKPRRWTFARF